MPGNARDMITMAERRFPVRIRIGIPSEGLGQRLTEMTAWLDENCGADGWAMTPSGMRGVLDDAVSIYFDDATLATAFVAPVVRRLQGRDSRGCVQGPERRARAEDRGDDAPDALNLNKLQAANRRLTPWVCLQDRKVRPGCLSLRAEFRGIGMESCLGDRPSLCKRSGAPGGNRERFR
jgi:hypothetical protein